MDIHRDANLHREQELLVSCILSARLLWQPKLFLDKGKDREEMRDTRWMNRGGGEGWRIGGKFETKRNADRERTKAFTVDRALTRLPLLFGSNRFVLFWDNVDEVLLRCSVSIDNLQDSLFPRSTNFPVDLFNFACCHETRNVIRDTSFQKTRNLGFANFSYFLIFFFLY